MTLEKLKALEAKATHGGEGAIGEYEFAILQAAPALIACAESLKACRRELQRACNAANYMSDEMAEALKNSDEALRRLEGV